MYSIEQTVIGFVRDPTTYNIAVVGGTPKTQATWPGVSTANYYALASALGLASIDPTNAVFAKPTNASGTLSTNGVILDTDTAGFTPSAGDAAFALDRNGRARPAGGAWTIGAYEYN
jgi:hypothetical protein